MKVNNDNNNDNKNSKNRNGIMIKVVLNGLQTLRNIELFLQSGVDITKQTNLLQSRTTITTCKLIVLGKASATKNIFFQNILKGLGCFLLLLWVAICVFLIYSKVMYRENIIYDYVYFQKYVSSFFLLIGIVRILSYIYDGALL